MLDNTYHTHAIISDPIHSSIRVAGNALIVMINFATIEDGDQKAYKPFSSQGKAF